MVLFFLGRVGILAFFIFINDLNKEVEGMLIKWINHTEVGGIIKSLEDKS